MKSKLGIALLGILIFLLGGIAGAVSRYLYYEHKAAAVRRTIPKVEQVVEGMAKELRLDAQQKESMKAIISDSRKRYRELSQQFNPMYLKIRNDSNAQIRSLLRDDQKVLYEEFLRKIRSTRTTAPKQASSK